MAGGTRRSFKREEIYYGGGGGVVAKLCLTLATPWTVAHQAPLSMGFPRQEDQSGLSFPSPGDLSNPRIERVSPAKPSGKSLVSEITIQLCPGSRKASVDET